MASSRIDASRVAMGSRVRLRRLDGDGEIHVGTVTRAENGPTHIRASSPLGVAIIGAEVGDVIPLLVDSRVRRIEVLDAHVRP